MTEAHDAETASTGRQLATVVGVLALAVPGLVLRAGGGHAHPALAALAYGAAVVSAAFVLAWAAEAVQLDISAGLALALLALVAVLPEYAVDFVFTRRAGNDFARYGSCSGGPVNHCHLALANMTGGNQLLVGVGWSAVVLIAAWQVRRLQRAGRLDHTDPLHSGLDGDFALERSHSVEIAYLTIASVWGLTLPFRHSLGLFDAAVLVAIFVAYMVRITRAPAEEPELVGPAALVGGLSTVPRRIVVAIMFVVSAGIIVLCAEHFASALVDTGREFGISDFLLVKWLAPLASEAPELLVAILFAWRLNTASALGALVSSKVNQWTLLVGTLPIVFAIASSGWHGLPLDTTQRLELFVTAAQSVFAIGILASRSVSVREAQMLLSMFVVQLVLQGVLEGHAELVCRFVVGMLYLVLAALLLVRQRVAMRHLLHDGFRTPYSEMTEADTSIGVA